MKALETQESITFTLKVDISLYNFFSWEYNKKKIIENLRRVQESSFVAWYNLDYKIKQYFTQRKQWCNSTYNIFLPSAIKYLIQFYLIEARSKISDFESKQKLTENIELFNVFGLENIN